MLVIFYLICCKARKLEKLHKAEISTRAIQESIISDKAQPVMLSTKGELGDDDKNMKQNTFGQPTNIDINKWLKAETKRNKITKRIDIPRKLSNQLFPVDEGNIEGSATTTQQQQMRGIDTYNI